MKPLGATAPFWPRQAALATLPEAAPARAGVRFLAISLLALLLVLAGRAVQLAFAGDPLAEPRPAAIAATPRGDIVDRNGVLLATTVRAYALTAAPDRVWNAEETARTLRRIFPDLDHAATVRRLSDRTRRLTYLRRSLSEEERARVHALGLAGIGFQPENRRLYPHGRIAAHVLGFTDVDLRPLAGVERGLDAQIRAAGEAGRPVRLALDIRIQYALETELAAAARANDASGAAGVLVHARTGEVLALVSWPGFDPNAPGSAQEGARLNRVAGAVRELGSTMKPFTVAMALQEGLTRPAELFDLSGPLEFDGQGIEDREPIAGLATLRDILARSSNIGAATLALRVGGARQRAYLERLGLTQPARLELGFNETPIAPRARGRRDVAGLGFGYGLAATPAGLAGAYTVFANGGAVVAPTLLARAPETPVERQQVFSAQTSRQVLAYLRAAVRDGTGRAADVPGLDVAGKTGTAEIFTAAEGYDSSRNFSSFAGVFPAHDPQFVIVVALDAGEGRAGGAVAAPIVARTLRRIAPMLGLRVEPAPAPG